MTGVCLLDSGFFVVRMYLFIDVSASDIEHEGASRTAAGALVEVVPIDAVLFTPCFQLAPSFRKDVIQPRDLINL
jgi:hypothetical protein